MKNLFNTIQVKKPNRNFFDLTHDVKLSFNMGELIPVCCMEAVPGDKFNISCETLVRFAPLIAPVMHRFNVFVHYFFVPNRLLWLNWENYITGNNLQGPAGPTTTPTMPYLKVGGPSAAPPDNNYSALFDYLGIPNPDDNIPANTNTERVNALPFAAYNKIYADYYRDENLIADDASWELEDGDNSASMNTDIRKRAWEHDYFTSALPWAQKGNQVEIPLGTVELDPANIPTPGRFRKAVDYTTQAAAGTISANVAGGVPVDVVPDTLVYDPNGSLTVGATTINDLRRAFRLQEWLEKNARGGTRYNESIFNHFGVKSPDQRLQRPEYIVGTKSPVIVSEVLNTTGTTTLPQGNMSGHGISVTAGGYGKYYCQEHGYIIGIMSVMPRTAYQQGIPRHFLKGMQGSFSAGGDNFSDGRFDFYWPEFANIGEQSIANRELFAFQGDSPGAVVFGYLPRYAEYKFQPSRVAGDFRNTLSTWQEGRIFATAPALNQAFVECVPDTRIFAVTAADTQHMYAQVLNKITAVRPMPKYGTPQF
ncbi:major capsid protein [Blackfly microvirus SF02]|uniref:Major capsid protein n=1 Tax=Blackfly microvirus SF02 TaxID=2576452 RepID=A0A4P8PM44_9VIRU|nr:major capsid protein [Blackfly microvirus SF02]